MDPKIKRLAACIDEILLWARENPGIKVPDREVARLLIALENIKVRSSIPDDLWREIKPKKEIDHNVADDRSQKAKQERIKRMVQETKDLNKDIIDETKKFKEQIQRIKHPHKRI